MTNKFLKEVKKLLISYRKKYDAMGNKRKKNARTKKI